MTTEAASAIPAREPALLGQTVVVLGGSAGIGLETARRARGEGADVFLTGRNPERLAQAARSGPLEQELQFPYHPHVTVAHHLDESALDHAYETLAGTSKTHSAKIMAPSHGRPGDA